MTDDKKSLINAITTHALEFGDFTLKSGQKSNYYLDCRNLTLSSEGLFEIIKSMWGVLYVENVGRVFRTEFDAIGGPSIGADPIVGAFCYNQGRVQNGVRGFLIRKQEKPHGKSGLIIGPVRPKDKVILVDDVASSGQTLADAFDVITDFGCEVIKAITIVDRQEGAETLLAQRGVPWTPLVTIEELRIDELADSKTGFTNTTDM